jgi:hypothetical protein
VPLFGPVCLLAGGAICGEPVSTWLEQGWWALLLYADVHTDWMILHFMRRGLGFGGTDNLQSDAELVAQRRRRRQSAFRVGAGLAIGALFFFEQAWLDAMLDGQVFHL